MSYFASAELATAVRSKDVEKIDELLLHDEYRLNHPLVLNVLIDEENQIDIEWLKWLRSRGLEVFPLAHRIRAHVQFLIDQDIFQTSKHKSQNAITKYAPVMEYLHSEWISENQVDSDEGT